MNVFYAEPHDFTEDGDWLKDSAGKRFYEQQADVVYDTEYEQYHEVDILPVVDDGNYPNACQYPMVCLGDSFPNLKEYQRNKLLKLITNTQE